MPLATTVDEAWVIEWQANKSTLWETPVKGPWAVFLDNNFAGWAGLQPDGDGEVELAVVLHVWAWNQGASISRAAIARWRELDAESSINVYFPLSRPIDLLAEKLNLEKLGEFEFGASKFVKLRLLETAINV